MILVITLCKSSIVALLIEQTTNQTESLQIKSNVGFLVRGDNQSTWEKTSRNRVENQQIQPTCDGRSGNPT